MQKDKSKACFDDEWDEDERFENESEDSLCQDAPDCDFPDLTDEATGPEQPSQSTRKRLRVKTAAGAEHGYAKKASSSNAGI